MTAPLRVEHVLPNLHVGGRERMVQLLVTRADRGALAPTVLVLDARGALAPDVEAAGVPVTLEHRRAGFLDPNLVLRLARRWSGRDAPDVVHAHGATAMVYASFAARLARPRVPVVFTEHGRSFPVPLHDRLLQRFALRGIARIVAVSESLRDRMVKHDRLPPSRIEVVPNGVDPGRVLDAGAAARVRSSLGLGTGPVALCVARLVPVKNHEGLLRAWARVSARHPDATLLLAGDGPERLSISALGRELGLTSSLRILGERHDVPDLLEASAVHVLASHSEGLSLTLLEAAAAGRPNIATDVGGNREVVHDGTTGILVPPGAEDDLAKALDSVLGDPDLRARLGRAAKALHGRRFTAAAMGAAYETVYRDVAMTRAAGHESVRCSRTLAH